MADEKSILEQFKGMKRQDLSDWERWGKKWFFRLLIGIPVSLLLIWLILLLLANHKLDSAKKRVAALGESLRYEDYAPAKVPPEENACLFLERASQIIVKNRQIFQFAVQIPGPGGRSQSGYRPQSDVPEITGDLGYWRTSLAKEPVVELFKIIDEAAPLENARYDTDYTEKPSFEIGGPSHLLYVDLIAQLLTVRAVLAMADGNTQDAYRDMTLGYRLAYWVGQEHPELSNASKSNEVASRVWKTTQHLFRSSPQNKQQRDLLVTEAKRLMEAEFILRGTMTQRIISSEMYDLRNIQSRAGGQDDARVWLISYPLRPWVVAYDAYITDCYTGMIELMKDPIYKQSLEQFHKDHPIPWYLNVGDPFIPFLHTAPPLYYRLRAEVLILQIACLLEDYREEEGNYPDSLDVFPDVPPDPFGGGPFHYQLKDGGYILYSISANLQDDGGTPPSTPSTWDTEGDIVWTMQPK